MKAAERGGKGGGDSFLIEWRRQKLKLRVMQTNRRDKITAKRVLLGGKNK